MNPSERKEGLKKAYQRLENVLYRLATLLIKRSSNLQKEPKGKPIRPQILAYRLLGEKTVKLLPLFKDMDVNLQKSGLNVSFKGYISLTLLTSLIASIAAGLIVPVVALLFFQISPFLSLLYTIGLTLFAGAFSIIGFYLYPIIKANNLKRNLEDNLPFTTGYLAILAGAGVPPARMFHSLAKIDTATAISHEARTIARDVQLFGVDIITAMESASRRTPSEKFKELLEGFIATIHSGGDLAKYLTERSRQYMRLKRIALRRLGDTLGVLAEFYVVLLVAGPLILVVMLAVMAMLGGGATQLFNPRLLFHLLTYLGIPLGSVAFLILLDVILPKR